MSSIHDCDFCDEFSGGSSNAFRARYGQSVQDRVILATESFRVFPSIGQLVEGYLLIAPVAHYRALDEMPTQVFDQLSTVRESVRAAMSKTYGPSLSFEHGAREPVNGGCGVYHAHLHVVPFPTLRDPVAELKNRFPCKLLPQLKDIATVTHGTSPYLLYEDLESNSYAFFVGNLSSQYMRRLLAEILGQSDWDWRAAGREQRLFDALARFSGLFDTAQRSDERPRPTNVPQ
jgi:diadenosine tetraphosphate (Ap4A) HIT family hydrolase